MNLRKAARKTIESLPKCSYEKILSWRTIMDSCTGRPCINRDGTPYQVEVKTPPCLNAATVKFLDMNIDLGWADQNSPGYLRCDAHSTIDVNPERKQMDLPQADLIRELELP